MYARRPEAPVAEGQFPVNGWLNLLDLLHYACLVFSVFHLGRYHITTRLSNSYGRFFLKLCLHPYFPDGWKFDKMLGWNDASTPLATPIFDKKSKYLENDSVFAIQNNFVVDQATERELNDDIGAMISLSSCICEILRAKIDTIL